MAKSFQVLNNAAIAELLHGPTGAVAKDLLKRGIRVQTRARRNLGGTTGSGPKRVNHGLLRASVATQLGTYGADLSMRVGTNVYYARWVHDGTGIYGPHGTPIVPRHAQALKFFWKKIGSTVYAKSVKGMRPNPFLKEALPFADGKKTV